tara:strand:+ start:41025 stop:41411 length:387 start_codon:yes stop_codon:yes gene_type:complete
MRFTLGKDEKLKSKKAIEQLFAEGSRIKSFPLQLIYLKTTHHSEALVQAGFTVPKRAVKLAVDRNRIKRIMREVYRKNKHLFSENLKEHYVFMFIYMTNKELKHDDLELSIKNISEKFSTKITNNEQS